MAKRSLFITACVLLVLSIGGPALACGGLIGPRGTVNLLRTTTFAGYVDGVEHYITSFQFSGQTEGEFGSIVPLPGVPTSVERGGDWTLQRLVREVAPPAREARGRALFSAKNADSVQVILTTKIDALEITVLKGGGSEVAEWAGKHGFTLSPDTPEVLDFYAERSPIFMAARFDAAEATKRGQLAGDGTPIHLTIPTPTPWVPLRILALGRQPAELVQADVFLLTERAPAVLPTPDGVKIAGVPSAKGMRLERSEEASPSLLRDLNSDKGMGWLPTDSMWFSYFKIDAEASALKHDLAIDASGAGRPSMVAAGFGDKISSALQPIIRPIRTAADDGRGEFGFWMVLLGLLAGIGFTVLARRQPTYR